MDIDRVISRCPFLHNIATTQGHAFASSIACNPLIPASHSSRRPLLEETQDLSASFRLFHGPQGVIPLASSSLITPTPCNYDFSTNAPSAATCVSSAGDSDVPRRHELSKGPSPFASAPLAAMSLGMVGEPTLDTR